MIVPPLARMMMGTILKVILTVLTGELPYRAASYWTRLFLNVAYQKGLKSANITDEKNEGKDKLALSNLSLGLGFIF